MNDHWEGIVHFVNSDSDISGGKGRYVGPFVGLLPEGHGVCVYVDGSTYEGEWVQGRFHGTGLHTLRYGTNESITRLYFKKIASSNYDPVTV